MIRVFAIATIATMALTGCANQSGAVPSPITAQTDTSAGATSMSPLARKTCATKPPQYEWIFKGACQIFSVTSTGGHFRLGDYQGITVKGMVGRNNAKGTVKVALADALDKNGDIKTYKGKAFPPYMAQGTTILYASAVNQSTQVLKPVTVKGTPVLQYTITNAKGFGDADACGVAVLTFRGGEPVWVPGAASCKVKGKTVTVLRYTAPTGFDLAPKTPLYFAVHCYKQ